MVIRLQNIKIDASAAALGLELAIGESPRAAWFRWFGARGTALRVAGYLRNAAQHDGTALLDRSTGAIIVPIDVAPRKEPALCDSLTGLPNRTLFMDHLECAKAGGGGQLACISAMGAGLAERIEIAKSLGLALAAGSLQLFYQPKIHLESGSLRGAEALLRWHDPQRGWISPAQFIPIAEARGMIGALGKWVLHEACRQVQAWRVAGHPLSGRLAVNLAAPQLEQADFAEQTLATVRAAGLTADCFELELTESGLMGNVENAIATMSVLRAAGFSLSIDDFGTGYSSLSYLKRLPADTLKIDISFVRDMLQARQDYIIVTTIIGMASKLGLRVVAEGVEELAQAEALLALGCDDAQGYYFGRPVPADEFAQRWLANACGAPTDSSALRLHT